MAHKHYSLTEAKKKKTVWKEMTGRRGHFFFPLGISFRSLSLNVTQALVRQREQSHVIGFFPIWATDSTMLITNWWEIH